MTKRKDKTGEQNMKYKKLTLNEKIAKKVHEASFMHLDVSGPQLYFFCK